ncbi:MAG: hypothetical protein ACK4E7_16485 [Permianibacter sp.]
MVLLLPFVGGATLPLRQAFAGSIGGYQGLRIDRVLQHNRCLARRLQAGAEGVVAIAIAEKPVEIASFCCYDRHSVHACNKLAQALLNKRRPETRMSVPMIGLHLRIGDISGENEALAVGC